MRRTKRISCLQAAKAPSYRLKRRGLERAYIAKVGAVCANPECESGYDVEAHHVIPIKHGEIYDRYWNLVPLCWRCHRMKGLHRRGFNRDAELFTWKCMHEMSVLGYVLDDEQEKWARIEHRERHHKDGSYCTEACLDLLMDSRPKAPESAF